MSAWKLVPVEPTPVMARINGSANWGRMLSASPDPTTDEALVERVARAIYGDDFDAMRAEARAHFDQPNGVSAQHEVEFMLERALAAIRAMETKSE